MSKLTNSASEKAVLAGICQHGIDAYIDTESILDEKTFSVEINSVIYRCIKSTMQNRDSINISDILSSAHTLKLHEFIEKEENLKYVQSLLNTSVDIDSIRGHALIIRRLQFARELQETLRDSYRNVDSITGEESLADIMSRAESPIQKLSLSFMKEEENTPKPIGQNIEEYVEHVKNNKGKSIGIPTGIPSFDKAIGGGLRRKCVDLIGARAKAGKSVLADNIALNVSSKGIPVLMLDTEMSTEDHWNRMLANISRVPINDIASGKFTSDHDKVDAVIAAAKQIKSIPYDYISIAGRPFDETLSIIRRWILKNVGYDENGRLNDCVIIYDYLKLMTSSSISNNMAEFQVLGFQITQLHNFCVEYDVPCLSFVQLNRDGITKESEDAVSGSDRLIWLCTSFSIFKTKTEEEIAMDGITNGNKKLIPVISRHGPGMDDGGYICMRMIGEIAKIEEIGTIREIKANAKRDPVPNKYDGTEDEDDGEDS